MSYDYLDKEPDEIVCVWSVVVVVIFWDGWDIFLSDVGSDFSMGDNDVCFTLSDLFGNGFFCSIFFTGYGQPEIYKFFYWSKEIGFSLIRAIKFS